MRLANVFSCYNPIEAERARSILREDGFEVVTHDQASTAFPMNDDANSRITLQVLEEFADRARETLKTAVADEALQGDGAILMDDD